MDRILKIIFWNCRSIRNKSIELFNFLADNNIDICLLSETWLKCGEKLTHRNYYCVRNDRKGSTGGGVAILIKKSLKFKELPIINTNLIENVGIEICSNRNQSFRIFSIYFPGGRITGNRRSQFKRDLRRLFNTNGMYLFCGDFNSRHRNWGCSRANAWGNILHDFTSFFPITICHPSNHSYVPSNSRQACSTLDLALTTSPEYLSSLTTVNDLDSDHLPVKFELNIDSITEDNLVFDFENADWHLFKIYLRDVFTNLPTNITEIHNTQTIDSNIEFFNTHVLNALEYAVPKRVFRANNYLKLPNNILNLIKVRNFYRRQWSRYRQDIDKYFYELFSSNIRKQILNFRNQKWNHVISRLDKCSKPFWNINKIIKKKNQYIPSLTDRNARIFHTNGEKAEELAKFFADNHVISANLGMQSHNTAVSDVVNQFNTTEAVTENSYYVNCDYVSTVIQLLKPRKSAGPDKIKNFMLKQLPIEGIQFLTYIFNSCIKFQYFPAIWKVARVVPIPKPSKPNNKIENYRPISLLSCVSKVFEKILNSQIWNVIEEKEILPNEQFGFRPRHSTTHQVKRVCNFVQNSFACKKSTALVLLDIEKAFDTVWHNGLIFKLIKLGFPSHLIKIIKSFLDARSFRVFVNNNGSDSKEVPAGVPQGSVLGPILFCIYCSDLPKQTDCEYAMFADDTGIYCSHEHGNTIVNTLQRALDQLSSYCLKWKIKLNAEKTQAIFFTKKRKQCMLPSLSLQIFDTEVPWSPKVKYLGVILDKKLTFKEHIYHIKSKVSLATKILYPLINRKSDLNRENKLIIMKVVFQALMLYACPVWGSCAKTHIQTLQVAQNKLLKMMLNHPWYYSTAILHTEANISFVNDRIDIITDSFINKCSISSNSLLNSLVRAEFS